MCVKCLICKCNANAPYQSALSHLEEGVEIIHESCHLSRSLSNLSVELWRRKKKEKKNPLVRVEKLNRIHQFSLFCFFFFSVVAEESVSCENPGIPNNGYQILSKRLYLPGESLTFVCYQGYELIGEVAIKCILGNPSFWSGPLPLCRGETSAEFGCFLYVWNETLPCFSFIFTFWIYCMNTMFLRLIWLICPHACWYRLIMAPYACWRLFAKPLEQTAIIQS